MKNLLVTGGAGFIGSNFINRVLSQKKNVCIFNLDKLTYAGSLKNTHSFDNDARYTFVEDDICNRDLVINLLIENEIDTIVHFAAESHVDRSISNPNKFIKTNIEGTQILLDAAKFAWIKTIPSEKKIDEKKFRFHHVSTDEVYGSLSDDDRPSVESDVYKPNSPYAASKASADHLVRSYYKTYSLPITISNCSNNFGPNQHLEKLIPTVIKSCIDGKRIPVYGTGKNIRDWIYVLDHVNGILAILLNGKVGETYNIGGSNEVTNNNLVSKICGIMDKLNPKNSKHNELIEYVGDRLGHDWRYSLDTEKIREELGWSHAADFDKQLYNTVVWYLGHLGN